MPGWMTVEDGAVLLDADLTWERHPYQIVIGEPIQTLQEALIYATGGKKKANLLTSGKTSEALDAVLEMIAAGDDKVNPDWFMKPYFGGTALGENEALNCYWQFSRDDDIIHPLNMIPSADAGHDQGMGRVYASEIQAHQQMLWLQFGNPEFTNLTAFYFNAIRNDMSRLINTGEPSAWRSIGKLIGGTIGFALTIPFIPFKLFWDFAKRGNRESVGRFMDFRPQMPMYFKYVDTMMAHMLVNMGFYAHKESDSTSLKGASGSMGFFDAPSLRNADLPKAIRMMGPSIYHILSRYASRIGQGTTENNDLNKEIEMISKMANMKEYDKSKWGGYSYSSFVNMTDSVAAGAVNFIGFRVEKNVDSSESFSNSSGPLPVAEQINSKIREARESRFNFAEQTGGSGGISGLIGGVYNGMSNMIAGTLDMVGLDGLASAATGGAYIDIPEMWRESSFGKSHSFTLSLRSPYGDKISIFQSIYVPLFALLAGALPRAAGNNSFGPPFMCRAYCKGMFSVPFGMIESINIKRGASEFGWNMENLPTAVDVSLTIKDLSPNMYAAMSTSSSGSDSNFGDILGSNSTFQEYLLTLAGTGLYERTSQLAQMKRSMAVRSHIARNRAGNPFYWAVSVGQSTPMTFSYSFTPWNKISNN